MVENKKNTGSTSTQTSRDQVYQQYWDVHERFGGDNGGATNTTQWGSHWADKTLQNPDASIWQQDGYLNINAFTSALDNYSNHQYNFNKQSTGNSAAYNSSASIYNQTPDWNNHYGSDVLGQYYQTGYNDTTVENLNNSWTERQASTGFQYQNVGATYTEYTAGNNGQTGTYNSYWHSSNPNSANYDNQYTHYDLGRHTVSEFDYLQYDNWADDTSYIDRYVDMGLGSQADAYNYVNNTSLHAVETYFDAQTANDVLLQAYQQDGFLASEMFENNIGPDVWTHSIDSGTGNYIVGDGFLSENLEDKYREYFDISSGTERGDAYDNFDRDVFGQTLFDESGSTYHLDAFGSRQEGEANSLIANGNINDLVRNDVITEDIIEQRFVGDSSSLLGVSIGDSFEEKEDGKPVAARPEQLTHRGWITEAVKGLTGHGGAYYSLEVQNGDESANADHQKFAFSIERIENPDGETGKVVTYSTHDALEVVNKDGETVLLPNASPSRIPDFTDNADVLLFRGLSDERGRTQVKVTDYGKGGDVTSKQEFLDIDENLQVTSATLSTSNNENGNAEGKLQYATYRNTTSDYIDGVDDPIYGYDSRGKRMKVVSADAADLEKKHGFSTIRPISDTPDELPQHYSAFGAETIERKVQITFGFVNEEENSGSTELFVTKRFKEGVKETTYVTEFLVLDEGASSKERRHLQQERSQTKSEIKTESINAFGQKAILEDMSVTSPVIVIETQYEDGQIVEQKNRVAKNVKEALEGGQLGNFAVIQSQVKSALDNHKDNETLENLYAVVTELASFDGDTNISMSGFDSHLYQPQESDLFMQVLDHVEENPKVREKFGLELIYPLDNSLAQKRISRDEEASLLDEFTDVSGTNVSSGVIGDVFDLKNKADDLLSDAYGIDKLIEGTESFTDGVKSALQDPTNRDALIALLSDDEDVALSLKGQSDSYITAQLERSLARIGHDILAAGFESGDPALIDKKELTISRLILENEIAGQNIDVPKDKHFNASSWISLARAWLPSATLAGGLVYSVSNLLNQRVENGNSIGQGGVSIHDTNHGIRQLEKYKSFINDVFSDVTNKRAASKANTFFYDAVRKSDATSANQLVKATALNLAIKEVVDSAPYKLATLKLTDGFDAIFASKPSKESGILRELVSIYRYLNADNPSEEVAKAAKSSHKVLTRQYTRNEVRSYIKGLVSKRAGSTDAFADALFSEGGLKKNGKVATTLGQVNELAGVLNKVGEALRLSTAILRLTNNPGERTKNVEIVQVTRFFINTLLGNSVGTKLLTEGGEKLVRQLNKRIASKSTKNILSKLVPGVAGQVVGLLNVAAESYIDGVNLFSGNHRNQTELAANALWFTANAVLWSAEVATSIAAPFVTGAAASTLATVSAGIPIATIVVLAVAAGLTYQAQVIENDKERAKYLQSTISQIQRLADGTVNDNAEAVLSDILSGSASYVYELTDNAEAVQQHIITMRASGVGDREIIRLMQQNPTMEDVGKQVVIQLNVLDTVSGLSQEDQRILNNFAHSIFIVPTAGEIQRSYDESETLIKLNLSDDKRVFRNEKTGKLEVVTETWYGHEGLDGEQLDKYNWSQTINSEELRSLVQQGHITAVQVPRTPSENLHFEDGVYIVLHQGQDEVTLADGGDVVIAQNGHLGDKIRTLGGADLIFAFGNEFIVDGGEGKSDAIDYSHREYAIVVNLNTGGNPSVGTLGAGDTNWFFGRYKYPSYSGGYIAKDYGGRHPNNESPRLKDVESLTTTEYGDLVFAGQSGGEVYRFDLGEGKDEYVGAEQQSAPGDKTRTEDQKTYYVDTGKDDDWVWAGKACESVKLGSGADTYISGEVTGRDYVDGGDGYTDRAYVSELFNNDMARKFYDENGRVAYRLESSENPDDVLFLKNFEEIHFRRASGEHSYGHETYEVSATLLKETHDPGQVASYWGGEWC